MTGTVEITLDGVIHEMPRGISILDALEAASPAMRDSALGAIINNMIAPLDMPVLCDAEIEPVTIASRHGEDMLKNTLVFMLAKCAEKLFPKCAFRIRNSINGRIFCTIALKDSASEELSMAKLALEAEMDALIERDAVIKVDPVSYAEAIDIFSGLGRTDELNLLKHRNPPMVPITRCEDFCALSQAPLVYRTALVDKYSLEIAEGGFLLGIDAQRETCTVPTHYMNAFAERRKWCEVVGVDSIGGLNDVIANSNFADFVRACESLHRKQFTEIAGTIISREPAVRLVLVAGPSSAGKTTTARRIQSQLMAFGRRSIVISTDDYFVGDSRNPRDGNGELDYECIEAVDCDLLAADMNALFAGETVHLRKFDFLKHEGYDSSTVTTLPANGIVIIEGIHALNPALTADIDDAVKFRVYLNTFTQLAVDCCNRISTRDSRLVRRIVRDYNYRGFSAKETIAQWSKVLAGEEKWIYPFQSLADATFNSALDYELAVLKPLATHILNEVKPWDREFIEARRLTGMLHNICSASAKSVPGDSILRETIGGSQLDY